jgi:hypothetical protein
MTSVVLAILIASIMVAASVFGEDSGERDRLKQINNNGVFNI